MTNLPLLLHNNKMEKIVKVEKGSIAWKLGLRAGYDIVAFDGHPYVDILDFYFYDSATKFTLTYQTAKGEKTVLVEKDSDQPLGIELEDNGFDIKPCKNRCVFCFVEQCPKNMRSTLYVKDDDYRLSFTCGSYITLTNLSDEERERIIRLKLSPLYISVHAFDEKTKVKLCTNPNSAKVFAYLKDFARAGITMHTQIVMVPGYNDGEILRETVEELYKLYPFVKSVAIVPVGLTGHRDHLTPLKTVDKALALKTVDFAEEFNKGTQSGFVWCSDEMYIIAGRELPSSDYYGDFEQIENGVGLVAQFLDEVTEELSYHSTLKGNYTLVTGVSFYPTLKRVADLLQEIYEINLDVKVIENDFFGHSVTVAGLLTGQDLIKNLKGNLVYKDVILPHTMFKEFEDVMLDGISIADLEDQLDCKIHVSHGGSGLIEILAGDENE